MKRIDFTYEEAEAAFKKFCDMQSSLCELRRTIEEVDDNNNISKKNKTVKWIKVHPLQDDDCGGYECSACLTGLWNIDGFKYCPYCGSEMEEIE